MDNNIEINSHKHQGRGDSLIRIDMKFFKHCYPWEKAEITLFRGE